ncbi:hypothetical protein K1719_043371 [Acacia pycnantha]|nr:hypothetical protein K1719_043371 [Acacia pycnantha]
MYPIERFLGKLKSYVRNKAWPEGSIAEGYIEDGVLYSCSRYFDDIETSFNRLTHVDDCPEPEPEPEPSTTELLIPRVGKPVGRSEKFKLTALEKFQAHRHVLINCTKVEPYL